MISSLPTDGQTLLDVKLLSRLKNNLEFSQNQVHLEIFKILSPEMCPLTFLWSSLIVGCCLHSGCCIACITCNGLGLCQISTGIFCPRRKG